MRYAMIFSAALLSATFVGCTGNKELPPDGSKVKQVDPVDIQKQIQEGMKQGGNTRQSNMPSAPPAGGAPATPAPSK